jgi:hypothetical protein
LCAPFSSLTEHGVVMSGGNASTSKVTRFVFFFGAMLSVCVCVPTVTNCDW